MCLTWTPSTVNPGVYVFAVQEDGVLHSATPRQPYKRTAQSGLDVPSARQCSGSEDPSRGHCDKLNKCGRIAQLPLGQIDTAAWWFTYQSSYDAGVLIGRRRRASRFEPRDWQRIINYHGNISPTRLAENPSSVSNLQVIWTPCPSEAVVPTRPGAGRATWWSAVAELTGLRWSSLPAHVLDPDVGQEHGLVSPQPTDRPVSWHAKTEYNYLRPSPSCHLA